MGMLNISIFYLQKNNIVIKIKCNHSEVVINLQVLFLVSFGSFPDLKSSKERGVPPQGSENADAIC